jgi:hypothetical protein
MPIALSDEQLAAVMAAAQPLALADRSAFLEDVAALSHARRRVLSIDNCSTPTP